MPILNGNISNLPGSKTTLTLYELSTSQGTSGGMVKTYIGIQTLEGSLQPLNASETIMSNKETAVANYKFIVSQNCFLNSGNEDKLIPRNQLRLGTRIFDIISSGARLEGLIHHYRVLLKEIE